MMLPRADVPRQEDPSGRYADDKNQKQPPKHGAKLDYKSIMLSWILCEHNLAMTTPLASDVQLFVVTTA